MEPTFLNSSKSTAKTIIYNQDVLAGLSQVADETVQLVGVTSPPYNIGKPYENKVQLNTYLQWQDQVIAQLYRVLKTGGSLCWQVGNFVDKGEVYPLDIYFYPLFKKLGLKLRNRIIWHFNFGLHASKRFSGRYESLLWFGRALRI